MFCETINRSTFFLLRYQTNMERDGAFQFRRRLPLASPRASPQSPRASPQTSPRMPMGRLEEDGGVLRRKKSPRNTRKSTSTKKKKSPRSKPGSIVVWDDSNPTLPTLSPRRTIGVACPPNFTYYNMMCRDSQGRPASEKLLYKWRNDMERQGKLRQIR